MGRYRPQLPTYFEDHIKQLRKINPHTLKSLIHSSKSHEKVYTICITSDYHGFLYDSKAFDCLKSILRLNHFDEFIINGDLLDFPLLGRHQRKMKLDYSHPILSNYTEAKEIIHCKENILAPISEILPDAPKTLRLGNHDERLTNPIASQTVVERIHNLRNAFGTIYLNEMLGLKSLGWIYDSSDQTMLIDGNYRLIHGVSHAKNAPEKNMQKYWGSGSTGHTHRGNVKHLTTARGLSSWIESGCMRTSKVEYMISGFQPDWVQGFATVDFYQGDEGLLQFSRFHPIQDGVCIYNGHAFTN